MNQKFLKNVFLATTTIALFTLGSGCSHSKAKTENQSASPAIETTDLGSSDSGNSLGLETVHFDYDSNLLGNTAKAILKKDAAILSQNPNVNIQIEGHCDERGGIQYNIALGERRASSVMDFLSDQGISKSRLTTISYGKERPLVTGNSEEAYAKNRRANLVITKK